jgi:hypothetical protein
MYVKPKTQTKEAMYGSIPNRYDCQLCRQKVACTIYVYDVDSCWPCFRDQIIPARAEVCA